MLPGGAIVLTGLGNAVTLVLGRVRSDRTGGNGTGQPERQQTGDRRLNNALLLHDFSSADGNERSARQTTDGLSRALGRLGDAYLTPRPTQAQPITTRRLPAAVEPAP